MVILKQFRIKRTTLPIFLCIKVILGANSLHAMHYIKSTFSNVTTAIKNHKIASLITTSVALSLAYNYLKDKKPSENRSLSQETLTFNNDIHVIFDMNGVLTKNSGEIKILGLRKLTLYTITHNPFFIKQIIRNKLYEFLSSIEERDPNETKVYDEKGNILPQIMCTWMKNNKNSAQLLAMVEDKAARNAKNLESNIVISIARMMFTPQLMMKTQQWIPQTLTFVDELKHQGYKVHILSNFDSETFKLMKKEYPDIFEKFDSILISGDVGLLKPDYLIYDCILSINNIKSNKAFFIDDTLVNIRAAEERGIRGVLCKSNDINSVRSSFYLWRQQLPNASSI